LGDEGPVVADGCGLEFALRFKVAHTRLAKTLVLFPVALITV
jgi:hypothetical protein